MHQADSIAVGSTATDTLTHTGNTTSHQLTPAQVISWLPRDATPEQQDSAIQANFKPAPIRWSQRPDTLHLPGHDAGKDLLKTDLPQYYREGFFSDNHFLHPELTGGRIGVAGDPVPYSIHHDNIITSVLLVCFLVSVIAFSNARRFIARQAKAFFYKPAEGTTEITETSSEMRFQTFLLVTTSLLVALLAYFYTLNYIGDTFVLKSPYQLISIYFGLAAGYFGVKLLLYTIVNGLFFGKKKNVQWLKSFLFITSMEGVALFPAVLLHAYFGLSPQNTLIYCATIAGIAKLLTLYKALTIFFQRKLVNLQFFLYFCTLEITPLLTFWGALVFIGNYLKINF